MRYGVSKRCIAIVSVIFLVGFIVFSFLVIGNVRKKLDMDTEKNLIEICTQGSEVVKHKISVYENKVELLSNMSQLNKENISIEDKIEKLKEVAEANGFIRIGLADVYGTAYTANNEKLDISKEKYFSEAMNGKTNTIGVFDDKSNELSTVVHSTPIISKGSIVGIVFAETLAKEFQENIIPYMYKGEGDIYIIDGNLKVMFSTNELAHEYNNRIVNMKKEVSELEDSIKLRILGAKKIKSEEEDFYLAYAPIENNSGWTLLSVVDESVASVSTFEIISYSIEIAVILGITFIVILILIFMYKKRSDEEIDYLAFVDEITGGRNFSKFVMDGNKILESQKNKNFAIVYFDIDYFEIINETFGDPFGEIVLWEIAQILKDTLPQDAIYTRCHRDNFVYLTSYEKSKNEVIQLVETITSKVAQIGVGNKEGINITVVSGIYYEYKEQISFTSKINKANLARIAIKENKTLKYNVFSEDLRKKQIDELNISEDIKSAVKNNKFEVYYQPKIDATSEKIVGCEALVRWKGKEGKFISPEYFIPIAEKNGLIEIVDRWVFRQVCSDIKEWMENGIEIKPISINLSRSNLYRVDLVESMDRCMDEFGVSPKFLEIEITETVATKNLEFIARKILDIKKLGIRVSMDDFGTGNSSLANLSTLPIDTIKLDRSFIVDIEDNEKSRNIVRSIVYLAKTLNLNVVAEGVENKLQCDYLRILGCDTIQGYYYAMPMDKEKLQKNFLT